ncbi:MAG: outer membrane protein assembly factor BamA [Phycisphaeraceae bacterium]|nr:MAG: outer membrane protein assembly factor BamA [Phycisphaeraceae bacterium]
MARAQADNPDAYEDRPIREIRITAFNDASGPGDPASPEITQRVENNIRSRVGSPYRGDTVETDVERLNRLGVFKRVSSFAQLLADGGVALTFAVEEQPIIKDVQVTGNRRLNDAKLAAAVDLLIGTPVDRFQIDRAARRIEDLYRKKGYYLARVTVDLDELEESNIVLFRIREGQRIKITDIQFEGNEAFEPRLIRREMETRTAGLLQTGELDDLQLDRDVSSIVTFYRNHGYLDARADRIIRPSPNSKEAVVVFLIDEGPAYTLRSLKVEYADGSEQVFSDQQLLGLMRLKPGDVYSVNLLDESTKAVRDAFGQLGYVDAEVRQYELRDTIRPEVDLLLRINVGQRYKTGEVTIATTGGGSITKQNVIRRQVEVHPERPLDTTAIERSKKRIRDTHLFSPLPPDRGVKITLQPPDPAEPEYRDVFVEVEETDTSSFDIGGAVSSDAGLVGRLAVTYRNFDVTDTPDSWGDLFSGRAFRGAGQTFQLEAMPGNQVQTYSISLSEPYLFETDYSGSVSAFFRDRRFDEYDEERFGGRIGLGRRFGTRWTGTLGLRLDSVALTNIAADRAVDVFQAADRAMIIGIGPGFARTSLDRLFLPNRGSRTEFSFEQVVGDYTFDTIKAEHSVYIPLREDFLGRATVLKLETRVAYQLQDQDQIPTYERLYMGGSSFRGFDYRSVSPKGIRNDTGTLGDDPVGGTWLLFTGLEIRQPIYEEIFHVVGFIDAGTVTNDPGFSDYRVAVGVGVRFSIPQLSPAPIALDFGYPIVKQDGDRRRVFTFSVDLPF